MNYFSSGLDFVISFFKALQILVHTAYCLVWMIFRAEQTNQIKKYWATEILNKLGYDLSINGTPRESLPLVFVGNHISYLDILILLASHPQVVFLAKAEIKSWPIIGPAAARAGTLFVNRSSLKDRAQIKKYLVDILVNQQKQLVIFPSGTTSLDEKVSWKIGVFKLAKQYNIPVQSFKIKYSPLRDSAYIDDDLLLTHIMNLFKVTNKKASIEFYQEIILDDVMTDAEQIRIKVSADL